MKRQWVDSRESMFPVCFQVKRNIQYIRGNLTDDLWFFTNTQAIYLKAEEWIGNASKKLEDFEAQIIEKMTKDGWDGSEDPENLQWSIMGALFYSIIVITTIGKLLTDYLKHLFALFKFPI